jgi:hypothetical protein
MMDLLAADLQRLRWRALAPGLCLTALVVVLAAAVIEFVHTAKHPFDPMTGFRGAFTIAATPIAFAGFVLGASLLGADYSSRALTTLLTWEPRRSRVLGARAIACALVTTGLSLVALLALTVALAPAAVAHGTGASLTTSAFASASAAAVRCALLAAAASVAGVSLAALGRSTAAAIAGLLIYLVAVEQAANGVAPSAWRWLIVADALSWITAGQRIGGGSQGGTFRGHTVATAGLLLLCAVVVLYTLATVVLDHRDIG